MVADAAASTGRTLSIGSHTPGGTTLSSHASNPTALSKITSEEWDYVVIQGQSQEPTFPDWQVAEQTYPYAKALCDSTRSNYACSQPVFYMTWGREEGDQANCDVLPAVCTYEGMDDLLALRYGIMAEDNDAFLSPVGALWRYIRTNHPDIALYTGDGSHPSNRGSYAAACSFYTVFFRADPTEISFDFNLDATIAQTIREACKLIVYDQLEAWNVGAFDTQADFDYMQDGNTFSFTNLSSNATQYEWYFPNGQVSLEENPVYTFDPAFPAFVNFVASGCNTDTLYMEIDLGSTNLNPLTNGPVLYPNPTSGIVRLPDANLVRSLTFTDAATGRSHAMAVRNWLDISELPVGMYLIQISYKDGQTQEQKFLKQD